MNLSFKVKKKKKKKKKTKNKKKQNKKKKKKKEKEEEEEESLHKGVNCFMPLRKHKNIYTSPETTPPSIKLHKPKVETLAPLPYCQHHYSLQSSSLTNQWSNS